CWISIFMLPRSARKKLLTAAVVLLTLLTWPPVEYLLSLPLEAGYPLRPFTPARGLEAIVVLAGGGSPPQFERPYALPDEQTTNRCRYAAWIYSQVHLPVLASGGGDRSEEPFAKEMRRLLLTNGVPAEAVWTELESRSTHENALFSARILKEHGI